MEMRVKASSLVS